ncbi:amidase [Cytobacillus sp. FJAT-54145]|uniref:Amidase n=1 Tax=Cytobacillus spartinae TaxID=3299023 RepID=A0ABW6KCD6_9BACI
MKRLVMMWVMVALGFLTMEYPQNPKTVHANEFVPVSTWLWDTEAIHTNKDEVLKFLITKHVNTVFLQINQDIPFETYEHFIRQARSHNIEIHALDGAPDWGKSKGKMDNMFGWLRTYQQQAVPNEKFSGVHIDVEPYLHEQWNRNQANAVMQYQTLLIEAKKQSNRLGLPIGIDIPFWFDEIKFQNKYGKGDLASWVIRKADSATLMAYRDRVEGPNGIIELIKFEVQLAQKIGKPIIIGVETGKSEEADYVSFHEEGEAYMFKQLKQVQANYNGNVTYAIHHLQSWMRMEY